MCTLAYCLCFGIDQMVYGFGKDVRNRVFGVEVVETQLGGSVVDG